MSLRWKVAITMALMVLAVTATFGFATYRSTRGRLMAAVDQSLRLDERGPRLADREDDDRFFQVIDGNDAVVQPRRGPALPVDSALLRRADLFPLGVLSTIEVEQQQYRVRTQSIRDRRLPSVAYVQVYRSLDEYGRVLAALRARTAALAAVVSGCAALLGWWFAGRLTAPLRRLTDAAEHIADTGNLDVDVGEEGADEVGRLAAGFNEMLSALRRSRADQQRLVQDAGHELRTPLTSLRTNVALLSRYPHMEQAERQQVLNDLDSETDELTALVNEIIAAASGELDDEPVARLDLRSVADDVADRFARRTNRAVLVTGRSSAPISGRQRAINRAVSCLVENACKFDQSGAAVHIEVGDRSVAVLDRGPGLSEVNPHHLFDRFYRAESSRSLPGSGLGLSIVKQVADRHNATVSATDRAEGGARFAIEFPVDAN